LRSITRGNRTSSEQILYLVFRTFGILYDCVLGWWLDPWMRRRNKKALLKDLNETLTPPVLGQVVPQGVESEAMFDYASVCLEAGVTHIQFTRGRGELSLSIAPKSIPHEFTDLAVVLSTLRGRYDLSMIPENLFQANTLLHELWPQLQHVFSEAEYPAFRERI